MAGDHLLELAVELGQGIEAAVDVGIAQHRAAYLHAFVVTLFLVHKKLLRHGQNQAGNPIPAR
ncbi:hypothetical protein D3C78_1995540 [compost metagenome]